MHLQVRCGKMSGMGDQTHNGATPIPVLARAVGDETPLGPATVVETAPVQRADHHELIREEVVGGPATQRDARLYLSTGDLKRLLAVAESSLTSRVVLHCVGVRVRTFRDRRGHVYQAWSLVHLPPQAEEPPIGVFGVRS